MNNLIERALIGYIKLLRVVRTLLFLIAADRGTGSTADLRNTQTKRPLAHLLALAGGDDHAGVRHGNADARDSVFAGVIDQILGKRHQCIRVAAVEDLADYASEDTKRVGMELIQEELKKIPRDKVREIAAEHIKDICSSNRRDFRF